MDFVNDLKLKYRQGFVKNGGRSNSRSGGQFSSDPNNKTKKYSKKKEQGTGPRRRQGLGGFVQA